nr:hypothetical protein [Bacillus subtilis]
MKRMHVLNTKGKLRHIQEPLQTARLLGKMVWKSGPWLMICMLFFILIEATVPLLQLYASKQVIDGVVKHDNAVNTEVWAVVYAGRTL